MVYQSWASKALTAAACAALAVPPAAADETYRILFGDLHVHTVYSPDAKAVWGAGPEQDPGYACEVAQENDLDFVAITDHDATLTDQQWGSNQDFMEEYNDPGVFTTLHGYEWTSGSYYVTDSSTGQTSTFLEGYGHRCVIFRNADVPASIFRHTNPRYNTPERLWAALSQYKAGAAGRDALTNPHTAMEDIVTELSPERAQHSDFTVDWSHRNAEFQLLVEVFSKHGSSEGFDGDSEAKVQELMEKLQTTDDHAERQAILDRYYLPIQSWQTFQDHSVQSALAGWVSAAPAEREAYRMGIIGSTDSHLADPGSTMETDSTKLWQANGALVAVHARDNTREAIFEALRARRVYATSGARIRLWFDVQTDKGTVRMGSAVKSSIPPVLRIKASPEGANSIVAFEVIKNGVKVKSLPPSGKVLNVYSVQYTDLSFSGDSVYYVRALQSETPTYYAVDNAKPLEEYSLSERAWSSPVYVTKAE